MSSEPLRLRPFWPLSLPARISAVLVTLGVLTALVLLIQARMSQDLVVHPTWQRLLEQAARQQQSPCELPTAAAVTTPGEPLRDVCLRTGESASPWPPGLPQLPAALASLPAGYYDEESLARLGAHANASVLIIDAPAGARRLLLVDLTELEAQQNRSVAISAAVVVVNFLMIAWVVRWLYRSLRHPVQRLARQMQALDPGRPAERLSLDQPQDELREIAAGVNGHLERVERFIERERSLLDQASHEFRTPLAVIAGAADVLNQPATVASLQPPAQRALSRIRATTEQLHPIMAALLKLSRERVTARGGAAEADWDLEDSADSGTVALHVLLPELIADHEHLLHGRAAHFVLAPAEPLLLQADAALLRILVGNLLRNAAESTDQGEITVTLGARRLVVQDSGQGFDTAAAAARYKEALRESRKPSGGQGLGLFLSQRICERYGWTLLVDSTPGAGTRATIEF